MFTDLLRRSRQSLQSFPAFVNLPENGLADVAVRRLFEANQRLQSSWSFLWGPAGAGKSHLIQHVILREQRRNPGTKLLVTTAADLVALLPADETSPRFTRPTLPDILICEEVDQLPEDAGLRGGLAICLEQAVQHRTRVLLTARCSPGQLANFPDRFLNRLLGGLVVGMSFPGQESLRLLAGTWADDCGLHLQSEHIELLVSQENRSPRQIKNLVFSLAEAVHCGKANCNTADIRRFLGSQNQPKHISLLLVAELVAHEFGVTVEGLRSRSRHHGLAVPRNCAMNLCRELTTESLTEIGRFFERSHTSVSLSSDRLNDEIDTNPSLREQLTRLRSRLIDQCGERCA